MGLSEQRIIDHLRAITDSLNDATNAEGQLGEEDARRVFTRARAAIARYAPAGSPYIEEARAVTEDQAWIGWKARQLSAIVGALREDYEHGGMQSVELVHADLFDGFLDLAGELLDKGYVAPAAVVAGSVLEEHLRKLADKASIARLDAKGKAKSVETLSIELRKASLLTEVQRKSLVAWYGQRNDGAHHQGANLIDTDVERMMDGIRDFVTRHPA